MSRQLGPATCLPNEDGRIPLSALPKDTTSKLAGLFSRSTDCETDAPITAWLKSLLRSRLTLSLFPKSSHTKLLHKMVFTAFLLGAQHIGIVWRTSRQACLLCPWTRHLTGCLHLHVADRWWGQASYPSWRLSLTKDLQREHVLIRMNEWRHGKLALPVNKLFSTFDWKSAYQQMPITEKESLYSGFEADGKHWEFNRTAFGVTNRVPQFERTVDKIIINAKVTLMTRFYIFTTGYQNQSKHAENVVNFAGVTKQKRLTLHKTEAVSSASKISYSGYLNRHQKNPLRPIKNEPITRTYLPHNWSSLRKRWNW